MDLTFRYKVENPRVDFVWLHKSARFFVWRRAWTIAQKPSVVLLRMAIETRDLKGEPGPHNRTTFSVCKTKIDFLISVKCLSY